MNPKEIVDYLYKMAKDHGLPVMGITTIDENIKTLQMEKVTEKLKTALVFGFPLSRAVFNTLTDGPNQLYFHHYRQANYLLDRVALRLSYELEKFGYNAVPVGASQTLDWKNQKGHLSHKDLAVKAGLGWKGRNNLLVHPEYGSRLRLVTILTDLPWKEKVHSPAGSCNGCFACIDICPAGAIKENPEDFDHIACFEMLKEFKRQGRAGQYICGLCIKVCQGKRGQGIQRQISP
ncbi:MAG: epoxyqueuosine reductase [Candidatus Eremiobacteraeota bacterium]|nr:epoxyqueuosine reductase [Candidatus Eremiobacteraeota bacterium]